MGSKGRRFSDEFKHQVVQDVLAGATQEAVARRHGIAVNTVAMWLRAYRSGRLGGEATGGVDVQRLLSENRQLKELLGKKELELEFLKRVAAFERERSSGSSVIASGGPVSPPRKRVRS
ncbi:transposase [bacterium]|nr:transposase [bacterium]